MQTKICLHFLIIIPKILLKGSKMKLLYGLCHKKGKSGLGKKAFKKILSNDGLLYIKEFTCIKDNLQNEISKKLEMESNKYDFKKAKNSLCKLLY